MNGEIKASLDARNNGTPIILFHHQAFQYGYLGEWTEEQLDAYRTLIRGRNLVLILYGHTHYSNARPWEGITTWTPGSVRQAPAQPPYSTVCPESFLVMRIKDKRIDVASWIFGNDAINNELVWVGGDWGWTASEEFTVVEVQRHRITWFRKEN